MLLGLFNNLAGWNGLILLFIVLLLFGAKRLPELARSLGLAIKEFNKAKDDVQRQITQSGDQPAPPPADQQQPPEPPQSPPPAA